MKTRSIFLAFATLLLGGCADNTLDIFDVDATTEEDASTIDSNIVDSSADIDASTKSCELTLPAENYARKIVVSRPYQNAVDGDPKTNKYEVLNLSESGEISRTNTFFEMRRTFAGTIEFRADGEVGAVAQEDGTIGIFRLGKDGVEVLDAQYEVPAFASSLRFDDRENILWVISNQWRNAGGGIYRVELDCDGRPIAASKFLESKLPYRVVSRGPSDWLLIANDVETHMNGEDTYLLDRARKEVKTKTELFEHEVFIPTGVALTANNKHLMITEGNQLSGMPNRVVIAEVSDGAIVSKQVLSVSSPLAVFASPFNNAALILRGEENRFQYLGYDENSAMPFVDKGELPFPNGDKPQLPYDAVMIKRGSLKGMLFVGENTAIRRIRFEENGSVVDLGTTQFGDDLASVTGAVGVQP